MSAAAPLAERLRLDRSLGQRGPVERFAATELASGTAVVLLRESPPGVSDQLWPSVAWERAIRDRVRHLGFPRRLDAGRDEQSEWLLLEQPEGQSLWDAWDDPDATPAERFGYLGQLVELLHALHHAGAALERLRPGDVIVTTTGQAVLADTTALIPCPLPRGAPLLVDPLTAPELARFGEGGPQADLFHFGGLLAALLIGRELTSHDFRSPGRPMLLLDRLPDLHPALGRIVSKTYAADPAGRFPSATAAATDPTGYAELLRSLELCASALARPRLEIAAWTTAGTVRSGNEDAFAAIQSVGGREDSGEELALLILADGMGGSEAGEVAAGIAVDSLRRNLLREPPFAYLVGGCGPPESSADVEARLLRLLHEANRAVYLAALRRAECRGMGCTADVVLIEGNRLTLGHVGDGRLYRLRAGRLEQLTRDHTTVGKLVEMGAITAEEAEHHPRRAELTEALGGRLDVRPDTSSFALNVGDWFILCSDGLPAALSALQMQRVLERAASAEQAARRLVNAANRAGAMDNVTVVVVRVS